MVKKRKSKKSKNFVRNALISGAVISSPFIAHKLYKTAKKNKDEEKREEEMIIEIIQRYFQYVYIPEHFNAVIELRPELKDLYKKDGNFYVFKHWPLRGESLADFRNRIDEIRNKHVQMYVRWSFGGKRIKRKSKKSKSFIKNILIPGLIISSPFIMYQMYNHNSKKKNEKEKENLEEPVENDNMKEEIINIIKDYFVYSFTYKEFEDISSIIPVIKKFYENRDTHYVFKEDKLLKGETLDEFRSRIQLLKGKYMATKFLSEGLGGMRESFGSKRIKRRSKRKNQKKSKRRQKSKRRSNK